MKPRLMGAICTIVFSFITLPSNAALISRLGGQAIYDTDLDITWLADANAGAGSAFDDGIFTTDGAMTWANANAWAASLTLGGFTDWRLPTTADPDTSCTDDVAGSVPSADPLGFNCANSELGHLFYIELGGTAFSPISTSGDPDLALFTNLQSNDGYWSGTDYAPQPINAWSFLMVNGEQVAAGKAGNTVFAWAVRSGDVGTVPVPAAAWLFGSGLLGLAGVARLKSA